MRPSDLNSFLRRAPWIACCVLLLGAPPATAEDFRLYFIGNSLSRGLTLPDAADPRFRELFEAMGHSMDHGTQLGAGVNLDEHWAQTRFYNGYLLKLNFIETWGEVSNISAEGPAYTTNDVSASLYRDYRHALQGAITDAATNTTYGHYTFDAVILQPYQSFLETGHYTAADQAKGYFGDRKAINNFLDYAQGNNPAGHVATRQFFIYSAWPRLEGIEDRAADTDADGVFSFSEFYDSPYIGGTPGVTAGETVPTRDYVAQLFDSLPSETSAGNVPVLRRPLRLIPVGEVFAQVDAQIRAGTLPGASNYFARNAAYYLTARLDGTNTLANAGFRYIYPPGQPGSFTSDFIQAQGIKNFYCDRVHMNDQPHSGPNAGTIGAYLAAATVVTCLTHERPDRLTPAQVAAIYEKFDAVEDAALIAALQSNAWAVVTADPRTGVVARPPEQQSYEGYKAAHFTPAEQADLYQSGSFADFDRDGLSNGFEFFLQTDPKDPADRRIWQLASGTAAPIRLRGLEHPEQIALRLFESTNLTDWSLAPIELLPASFTNGIAEYLIEPDPGEPRRFYFLRADYPVELPQTELVQWGAAADIVEANKNLVAGLTNTVLNLAVPSSPAVSTNTGTSRYTTASPLFHATLFVDAGVSNINPYRITNTSAGGNDTISVRYQKHAAAPSHGSTFVVVWTQSGIGGEHGFLNGASTGPVTLASIGIRAKSNSAPSECDFRFIIRLGGQFYLSEPIGTTTSSYADYSLSDLVGTTWYLYYPTTDVRAIGAAQTLYDFNPTTAVGIYWRAATASTYMGLDIESFSARFFDF